MMNLSLEAAQYILIRQARSNSDCGFVLLTDALWHFMMRFLVKYFHVASL